jgi:hypothetical protein
MYSLTFSPVRYPVCADSMRPVVRKITVWLPHLMKRYTYNMIVNLTSEQNNSFDSGRTQYCTHFSLSLLKKLGN